MKKYRVTRGYKYLRMPSHPDASVQGYIAEHRLVGEKIVGRRLKKSEVVHHKNHDRGDNRRCNLEVVTRRRHSREHALGVVPTPEAMKNMRTAARLRKRDKTGRFVL